MTDETTINVISITPGFGSDPKIIAEGPHLAYSIHVVVADVVRVVRGPTAAEPSVEKRNGVTDAWGTVGPLADVFERPDRYGPLGVKSGEPFLTRSQHAALTSWFHAWSAEVVMADFDNMIPSAGADAFLADLLGDASPTITGERTERIAALPFETAELAALDALTHKHTTFHDLLHLLEAGHGYRPTLWTKTGKGSQEGTDARTLELRQLADAYDKAQEHRGDPRRAFRGW